LRQRIEATADRVGGAGGAGGDRQAGMGEQQRVAVGVVQRRQRTPRRVEQSPEPGVEADAVGEPERRPLTSASYISRPPVASERLALTASGHVRNALKTPYRDGTRHIVLEPLDFIARLAVLVPPPRRHLTPFHGVFAPHSKLRAAAATSGSSPASSSPRSSGLTGRGQSASGPG
jgi:hypothetical protein